MPKITINKDKCTGCQTCINACSSGVFEFDDKENKVFVAKLDVCLGCKACEGICPEGAITVTDN